MNKSLKGCPFCGRTPKVLQRPDSLDGYFCAISCFCGGYSAKAHCSAAGADESEAYMKAALRWNRRPEPEITGDTSDGYHTFNELYHHRAMLFSVICNDRLDRAWKSKMHHDGTMYDGMFIVGIQTPNGQATYHYDIDPYWDMFRVPELSQAPEWDGHTPEQAIERIGRLTQPENKPLTNADRIRSMTDGELAQILVSEPIAETIPFCQNKPECERLLETASGIPESMCAVCALDWLQKPVEVVNSD